MKYQTITIKYLAAIIQSVHNSMCVYSCYLVCHKYIICVYLKTKVGICTVHCQIELDDIINGSILFLYKTT